MQKRVLVNGLAMGSGGGYTVGRMIFTHLAEVRPEWHISMLAIEKFHLHEELRSIERPQNTELLWAPPEAIGNAARDRYERTELKNLIHKHNIDWVFQTNGMEVPGLGIPTFSHFQDPWPYRPEAWDKRFDFLKAWLKRRRHRYSLLNSARTGWTSQYLYDLTTGHHKIKPKAHNILYNGIPESWLDRAAGNKPWNSRPNLLVTVSNVSPYKRQNLVIKAIAELVKMPAFRDLEYRIAGAIEPGHEAELQELISRYKLSDHVFLEGRVSDERVTELLSQAKAFTLMSVCESFGIPAIEAMSFGTPAVVADCCAIPEVCDRAGVLVEMDNRQDLIDKLQHVLSGQADIQSIQQAGYRNIQRFRWTTIAETIAQEIEGA